MTVVPITLYQNEQASCPFAQRPMIALAEKGLQYTLKKVACRANIPKDPELTEAYRSIHPDPNATVLVPVMFHETESGTVKVIESGPCVEYLEDAFPEVGQLRPSSPKLRNQMRLFLEVASKWGPFGVMMSPAADIEKRIQEFAKASVHLNTALEKWSEPGGDFLLGEKFSIAEVLLAPMVMRLQYFESFRGFNAFQLLKDLGCNRLAAWCQAVSQRPSVTSTTADLTLDGMMLEYLKFRGAVPLKVSYVVKDGNVEVTNVSETLP
jgi:glutathione S-transferase